MQRRLADDSLQPAKFAFNGANTKWAKGKIKQYPESQAASAVIPLLMRAQEQEGWVSRPAIEYMAEMLEMPLIRVLEVATFYTQFQLSPVGKKAHIQVCGTTPCLLRGADLLLQICKKRIHPEHTTPSAMTPGGGAQCDQPQQKQSEEHTDYCNEGAIETPYKTVMLFECC